MKTELTVELRNLLRNLSDDDKLLVAEVDFGFVPDEDNEGQIVFYTGLMDTDDDSVVPFVSNAKENVYCTEEAY